MPADSGDPPWTIIAHGHTARGWPWYLIRKAGGQLRRVTVHGARATTDGNVEAISLAVDNLPERPDPDCF